MKFYNFYTNLNSNDTSRRKNLNRIKKILICKDDPTNSTHYSSQDLDFGPDPTSPNFRSTTLASQLNPTVSKNIEEQTLPFIRVLNRNANSNVYLRDQNPALAFAKELNPLNGGFSSDLDELTKILYGMFSKTPSDHLGYIDVYFRDKRSFPNQNFLTFLKVFENTYNKSKEYELNLEVHQSFLDDGYVCWVDSFESTDTLNNSPKVSPFKEITNLYINLFKFLLKIKNGTEADVSITDKGRILWEQLSEIDEKPSFSHLEFERPTRLLLTLSDEEIQQKIDALSSVEVFNYLKMNTLKDTEDEKIFSHFSNKLFAKLKQDTEDPALENENNLIKLHSLPMCLQFANSTSTEYNWEFSSLFNDYTNSRKPIFNFPIDETTQYIPLGGTTGLLFSDLDSKFTNINVPESLHDNPNSRVSGLIFNAFSKASNKSPFEFTTLTKKQALIRKGFFIPVLVKFLFCNSSGEIELGYNFSLLNYSDTFNQVRKRRRSRKQLQDFLLAYGQDGLRLVDYEKYLRGIKEKLKSLSEFSVVNSDTYSNYDDSEIEGLINSLAGIKKNFSDRTKNEITEFSDAITASLNIKPAIKKKYLKVNTYYNKLITQNIEARTFIRGAACDLETTNISIQDKLTSIQDLNSRINKLKLEIIKNNDSIRSNFSKRVDLIKTISANKSLHQRISTQYQLEIQEALKNNDYSSNSFFKNLFDNEGIKILRIGCEEEASFIDCNSSTNFFQEYSAQVISKQKKLTINEVEFLIDKPVKISVDAGKKGEVVAGPYVLRVKQNSIQIALAYPSSIHGFNSQSLNIHIHPHASSATLKTFLDSFNNGNSQIFRFSNCCLGEASSLLYKAFEKNDLKIIVISALTWVKNANSADPWGRNYIHFPKYQDFIKGAQPLSEEAQDAITEDDVDEFIEGMIISQEAEQQDQNLTQEILTLPQQEPEEEPEEEETPVGIESFNTTETYTPYTWR
jgi:hypothetical protein